MAGDTESHLLTNVKHNLSLLHKAVELLEPRLATRALRSLPALRKKLGEKGEAEDLAEVLRHEDIFPKGQSCVLVVSVRRSARAETTSRVIVCEGPLDRVSGPPGLTGRTLEGFRTNWTIHRPIAGPAR